mmetsp:Transcript_14969/g.26003  ORF Transcript_14969/g.26003 Transcript_14969/m.26003 type:complete len:243 (+) Transcript_14969:345-1073(+)
MHGSNARTCQHANRQLYDHRHVHGDTIALFHAHILQDICDALYFIKHLRIGPFAPRFGILQIVRLEIKGDTIAEAQFDVSIQGVVANICHASLKPFIIHLSLGSMKIKLHYFLPFGLPEKLGACNIIPKLLRVTNRLFVNLLILLHVPYMRTGVNCLRRHADLILIVRVYDEMVVLRRRQCVQLIERSVLLELLLLQNLIPVLGHVENVLVEDWKVFGRCEELGPSPLDRVVVDMVIVECVG